jgi:hypothetical protein
MRRHPFLIGIGLERVWQNSEQDFQPTRLVILLCNKISQGVHRLTDLIAEVPSTICFMKPREIRLPPSLWIQHQLAMPVLSRSSSLRRKIANVAEISDFLDWQLATFGSIESMRSKSLLWKRMSARMRATGEQWHGMEFGVAFGYTSNWWLSNHDSSAVATWDGFDRFTGLPRSWRGLPTGTFDNGGQMPAIDDDRATWHVGDIENTIKEMSVEKISTGRRLAYFDLDLYEPSKVVWDWIYPHLRPGDILYFDEAFDADERRLLNESIIPAGTYDFIGATDMNLAIEIQSLG